MLKTASNVPMPVGCADSVSTLPTRPAVTGDGKLSDVGTIESPAKAVSVNVKVKSTAKKVKGCTYLSSNELPVKSAVSSVLGLAGLLRPNSVCDADITTLFGPLGELLPNPAGTNPVAGSKKLTPGFILVSADPLTCVPIRSADAGRTDPASANAAKTAVHRILPILVMTTPFRELQQQRCSSASCASRADSTR